MTTDQSRAQIVTTHRFVQEDLRTLAGYLDVALETLEDSIPVETETGLQNSAAYEEALIILRRIKWHLSAPVGHRDDDHALITTDQIQYLSPRKISTFIKPRTVMTCDTVEALLRAHIRDIGSLKVDSVTALSGGRSKLMALVKQTGCSILPSRFVFRQDWAGAVTGTSVKTEYAVMHLVNRSGVKTPAPLYVSEPDTKSEQAFLLMEWAPGYKVGDYFFPPADIDLALALAHELAGIHRLSTTGLEALPGVELRDHGPDQLAQRLTRFASSNETLGQGSSFIEEAIARLRGWEHDPKAPVVLVHGDLGFHNLLADHGKLTAILDWEFSHLGHPAEDLGYIRRDIEKIMPWDDFLAAYHAAGGPVCSASAIDFYQLWGIVRLYCMLIQARAALRAGLVRDVGAARMCTEWIPLLIETLSDTLRRIDKN